MSSVEEILQFVDKVTLALHLDTHKSNVLALYCATNQNKFQEWKDYSSTEQFNFIMLHMKTPTIQTNATEDSARSLENQNDNNGDSRDSDEQMEIYNFTSGHTRGTVSKASAAKKGCYWCDFTDCSEFRC